MLFSKLRSLSNPRGSIAKIMLCNVYQSVISPSFGCGSLVGSIVA